MANENFDQSPDTTTMVSSNTYNGEGFVNHPRITLDTPMAEEPTPSFWSRGYDKGRQVFSGVQSQAYRNPWMNIAVVGVLFAGVGYVLGKRYSKPMISARGYGYDTDEAAAEDLTMSRSY